MFSLFIFGCSLLAAVLLLGILCLFVPEEDDINAGVRIEPMYRRKPK